MVSFTHFLQPRYNPHKLWQHLPPMLRVSVGIGRNVMKKSLVLLITVFALLGAVVPMVGAQDGSAEAVATLTFTEAEINQSFWVTNPANRHLSSVTVDLQSANEGQVVISALYTWRPARGEARTVRLVVTLAPEVVNGRLIWRVTTATADGYAATADQLTQINRWLAASWYRWVQTHAPAGVLTDVAITDSDITFTYTPRL
jgi:hypothetical protein